jgi:hypothetical protein
MSPRRSARASDAERILGEHDASLLDIVDNVLNKGVVLSGDVTIALAQVDLVYARLSLLLCAADRVLPQEDTDFIARHHKRHQLREFTRSRGADPLEPVRRRAASPARGRRV